MNKEQRIQSLIEEGMFPIGWSVDEQGNEKLIFYERRGEKK